MHGNLESLLRAPDAERKPAPTLEEIKAEWSAKPIEPEREMSDPIGRLFRRMTVATRWSISISCQRKSNRFLRMKNSRMSDMSPPRKMKPEERTLFCAAAKSA